MSTFWITTLFLRDPLRRPSIRKKKKSMKRQLLNKQLNKVFYFFICFNYFVIGCTNFEPKCKSENLINTSFHKEKILISIPNNLVYNEYSIFSQAIMSNTMLISKDSLDCFQLTIFKRRQSINNYLVEPYLNALYSEFKMNESSAKTSKIKRISNRDVAFFLADTKFGKHNRTYCCITFFLKNGCRVEINCWLLGQKRDEFSCIFNSLQINDN